jgi:transposase
MARYKPIHQGVKLLALDFDRQILPGTFEYALRHLVDHELDLEGFHQRYKNDVQGAAAFDPAVLLKIILLAYSRGIISSRKIESACRENMLFIAISGDSQPHFTTLAAFIANAGELITKLSTQVLLICDRQGLIGKEMFDLAQQTRTLDNNKRNKFDMKNIILITLLVGIGWYGNFFYKQHQLSLLNTPSNAAPTIATKCITKDGHVIYGSVPVGTVCERKEPIDGALTIIGGESPLIDKQNSYSQSSKSSSLRCDGRVYCSQMNSCEEATFFLNNCPNLKMDGNNDGIPCEKQWCK